MNRKYVIISFSLIVLLLVFGSVYFTAGNSASSVVSPPIGNVTLTDLSKHSTEGDCWVGFQGKAYDLTSWLPRHPGSAGAISPYCGTAKEFEQAFIAKHGQRMVELFMKVAIFMGDLKLQGNING